MTETLWQRYSESWSMAEPERRQRLAETVSADVTYTDPTTTLTGIAAFSAYMAAFQANVPATGFAIREVFEHHGQTLSHWDMIGTGAGVSGNVLGTGTSFAVLDTDGKLARITGFFAVEA